MSEKIFGDISSSEDLNELANNLRKTKEFDEVRLLCKENSIPEDVAEKFIKGDRLILVEMGYLENRKALQSPTWQAVRAAMQRMTEQEVSEVSQRIKEGLLLPLHQESDTIPIGTCSLNDIVTGIPKPTAKEIKATEENLEKPPAVYTIEDVKKKLETELQIYRDGDSKYVVEKLIERCGTDKELLNAVMLPHKSYDKAFQYFYERSRSVGYKMPHGNMVYLDNDRAVELSVEYFKRDDAAEEKRKAEKKKVQPKEKPKEQAKPKPAPNAPKEDTKKSELKVQEKKPEPKKEPEKPRPEPKVKKKEIDGQMSFFDF